MLPDTSWSDCEMIYFGDPNFTLEEVYHPTYEIGSDTSQPGIYRTADGTYSAWYAIFPKVGP